MNLFSTCADCGTRMQVTEHAQTVHPGCAERPTRMDRLLADYLAAAHMGDQPDLEAALLAEIDTLEGAPPRLVDAALVYASWGWPVFPLLPLATAAQIAERTGETVTKVAKRPATRHGFKDATIDTARIAAWWKRHPDSNIGLATGHHFDVVDVDMHKPGARESLAQIQTLPLEVHGRVDTASGGYHLYVEPMGGGNGADRGSPTWLKGIDFRGMGGYVVAPPSWLGTRARRWSWITTPSPEIRS